MCTGVAWEYIGRLAHTPNSLLKGISAGFIHESREAQSSRLALETGLPLLKGTIKHSSRLLLIRAL